MIITGRFWSKAWASSIDSCEYSCCSLLGDLYLSTTAFAIVGVMCSMASSCSFHRSCNVAVVVWTAFAKSSRSSVFLLFF